MIYKCKMCGHLYDESKERVKFVDLPESWVCPVCGAPKSLFEPLQESVSEPKPVSKSTAVPVEDDMALIQQMAATGETVSGPMGTRQNITDWHDVVLLGGGLASMPLVSETNVDLKTTIGRRAKKPMELQSPIMVSHMSFGALSESHKLAIAKASKKLGASVGSGEGGILPTEFNQAYRYIFEYVPNLYSVTDENLQKSDAIEIKISQAAKPGLGGHLPGAKVTEKVAAIRNAKVGQDIHSPACFSDIHEPFDLLLLVNDLRERSGGRPIGIKLAAGNIEEDLKWVKEAKADFVTIDGRGGGTGSAPLVVRDGSAVPTLNALYRARKYIDENHLEIELIVTGGLRTSADCAKALAMGADGVALATTILIALATDSKLSDDKKVENLLTAMNDELKMFARALGHDQIHDLSVNDIATTSREISEFTNIKHV
ncbi:MAG: alpha-hydroxy-acid oxidizing protein [Candidatus Nomurabacteria bacterium]|jgi:glutamate synthase domain-containing protein 2/rubredoxin|nr:alpha-hydroxy-acid oxidizing protein [Candidatus Nomurabacteria bacterium]